MHPIRTCWAGLGLGLVLATSHAQDATRGARLYLGLPGGEASCVECHGPDPGQNRNRLLNAAQGAFAIDLALVKAAPMGYLGELLSPADRADLSAWLARVNAEVEAADGVAVWPWGLEFGRAPAGSALPSQPVRVRNPGPGALALAPTLVPTAPGGDAGLLLTHDCPAVLPPGEVCTAWVGWVAPAGGRAQAALAWTPDGREGPRPVGLQGAVATEPAGRAVWSDAAAGAGVAVESAPGTTGRVTLALRNEGAAALTLGVPAITGPGRAAFRLEPGGCATQAVLAPGAGCMLNLAATAPTAGQAEALLQWRNDGAHPPARRLVVRAVGSAPPPAPAPPPTPAPPVAPGPSPMPVPSPPAPADTAGGGCSRVSWDAPADPVLPGLVALAVWLLAGRSLAQRGLSPRSSPLLSTGDPP